MLNVFHKGKCGGYRDNNGYGVERKLIFVVLFVFCPKGQDFILPLFKDTTF